MTEPSEGWGYSDWQIRLAMAAARWGPLSLALLGLGIAIGGIAWAMAGGVAHLWSGALKVAVGLIVGSALWWFAGFVRSIAADAFSALHQQNEYRQRAQDTRGYFLFLRSFRDQAFAVHGTKTTAGNSTTLVIENLSERLEWGLRPYGRFIMIGSEPSADPFRDSTVMAKTDDANWWSVFERLLANARCVFLVPESSAGLLREFNEVLQAPHRGKAVIVMPRIDDRGERARRWEDVRAALAQTGFELPPYDPAGCFYLPDERLRPVTVFPFGASSSLERAMRRAFRAIDRSLPRATAPFNEALTWIELAHGDLYEETPGALARIVNRGQPAAGDR